jgi:hypothetical protein
MTELASAIEFLKGLGGHYTPAMLLAAKKDGLTLPNITKLTSAMRAALMAAGWKPPTSDSSPSPPVPPESESEPELDDFGLTM